MLKIGAAICAIAGSTASAQVTPRLYALGRFPGSSYFTLAQGVSADGSVVVGYGVDVNSFFRGLRWTAAGGMLVLPVPAGASDAHALSVSGDGSVTVGYSQIGGVNTPTIWDASGQARVVDMPAGATWAELDQVSLDGLTAAGTCMTAAGVRPYVWTAAGSTVLGILPSIGPDSLGLGISGDGTTLVGMCGAAFAPGVHQAFVWSAPTGMVNMGVLGSGPVDTIAYAASGDGSVVIGDAGMTGGGRQAFRWTAATGMEGLGAFPVASGPTYSYARAVSVDGRIVTGYSTTPNFQEVFVWTQGTGMRNLLELLTNTYGVDTSGWLLEYGYGISADGTTIVGMGTRFGVQEGFVAVIPRICDANCDGSTAPPALNANDFQCFLNRFAVGDTRANCDGSVTPPILNANDFACFINLFTAGCS
jgi:probable HAF family extracellular repeat protein